MASTVARRRGGAAVGLALVSWVGVLIVLHARMREFVRFSCDDMGVCVRVLCVCAMYVVWRFAETLFSHSWGW